MNITQLDNAVTALQNISKEITQANNNDFGLTTISLTINGVLAFVVAIQLWYYRHEISSRLRPWIGGSEKKGEFEYDKQLGNLIFHYHNYGQMPAISVHEKWNISDKIRSRKEIEDIKGNDVKSITFPNQERRFSFHISDNPIVKKAIADMASFYVEIGIEYEFGKRNRAYYHIAEYKVSGQIFTIDEWVK